MRARTLPGVLVTLAFVLILAACTQNDVALPLESMAAETDTSGAGPDGSEISPPAESLSEQRQVVIWAPEFWFASDESPAGQIVEDSIAQFEQTHDGTKVEIHTKAEVGAADMLSTLRSAQKVAPAILPDAVLMNAHDLWRLAELGLATPLTDTAWLSTNQFYPFAETAVMFNGLPYGIPYATDLVHAGTIDPFQAELPTDWEALLTGNRRYLFPRDGLDGVLSLLLQYVGAGGVLDIGDDTIDQDVLTAIFEFYAAAVADGIVPAEAEDFVTMEDVWRAVDPALFDIADTRAGVMLRLGEMTTDVVYAPAPTRSGDPTSIARTWAFVVLADEPGQRQAVFELIQGLLDPNVQGQWTRFSRLLPTTRESATVWGIGQPYGDFLIGLMDGGNTYALPNGRSFFELIDDMQNAQQAILTGQMTPAEAAASVRPSP